MSELLSILVPIIALMIIIWGVVYSITYYLGQANTIKWDYHKELGGFTCDNCGGFAKPTGIVYMTYPEQYECKCVSCGHTECVRLYTLNDINIDKTDSE